MADSELERLIEDETFDRLARVASATEQRLIRLARSLIDAADAIDALAAARSSDPADMRRAEFRRKECPGRF